MTAEEMNSNNSSNQSTPKFGCNWCPHTGTPLVKYNLTDGGTIIRCVLNPSMTEEEARQLDKQAKEEKKRVETVERMWGRIKQIIYSTSVRCNGLTRAEYEEVANILSHPKYDQKVIKDIYMGWVVKMHIKLRMDAAQLKYGAYQPRH